MNWSRLDAGSTGTEDLREWLVEPIRHLAGQTIDLAAIGWGIFSPVATISDEVVTYYRKFLFGDHTLQDLPADAPRIVLNATNVKTGSLWRFSRPW